MKAFRGAPVAVAMWRAGASLSTIFPVAQKGRVNALFTMCALYEINEAALTLQVDPR